MMTVNILIKYIFTLNIMQKMALEDIIQMECGYRIQQMAMFLGRVIQVMAVNMESIIRDIIYLEIIKI